MDKDKNHKQMPVKLVKWWHPTLNGDLRPKDVSPGMDLVVWFRHYDRKWKQWHEWDARIGNMSRRKSCPICSGKRVVSGINDLATRNKKVASMLHPTLNGDLTPQMVTEHSNETRWFQHYDRKTRKWHEWPMTIAKLTGKKTRFCSVCSGHRIQVGVNDLETTHPELVKEWHPTLNGQLTPQMVTKGSEEEISWIKDCLNDGIKHIWHAQPKDRTSKKLTGCSICEGRQIQIGVNDLASQYPALIQEWDLERNGKLTPQMVTKSSSKKVFWKHRTKNSSVHRWPAMPKNRTKINPTGCPERECSMSGFDQSKSAHLYVVLGIINEIQVIQFGISNNIQRRLSTHIRSGFKDNPIFLMPFSKGSHDRLFELALLDLMEEHDIPSYNSIDIKFDGSTEAFCLSDVSKEFLKELTQILGL